MRVGGEAGERAVPAAQQGRQGQQPSCRPQPVSSPAQPASEGCRVAPTAQHSQAGPASPAPAPCPQAALHRPPAPTDVDAHVTQRGQVRGAARLHHNGADRVDQDRRAVHRGAGRQAGQAEHWSVLPPARLEVGAGDGVGLRRRACGGGVGWWGSGAGVCVWWARGGGWRAGWWCLGAAGAARAAQRCAMRAPRAAHPRRRRRCRRRAAGATCPPRALARRPPPRGGPA